MAWKTVRGSDGVFYFQKTKNGVSSKILLKGISLNGLEYLPNTVFDRANFYLAFFCK